MRSIECGDRSSNSCHLTDRTWRAVSRAPRHSALRNMRSHMCYHTARQDTVRQDTAWQNTAWQNTAWQDTVRQDIVKAWRHTALASRRGFTCSAGVVFPLVTSVGSSLQPIPSP